jgi:hypothetical protein
LLKLRLAERSQTLGAIRLLQTMAIGLLQQNCCLICYYVGLTPILTCGVIEVPKAW